MNGPAPSLGRAAGSALRWNAGGAAVALLSQFLQLVILARWLPPAEFGLAAAALAIAGFAAGFADLGLANALVQSAKVEEKDWSGAAWACGLSGIVLMLLMAALSGLLETAFRLQGLAPLALAAGLSLPFAGTAAVFQADLQRRLSFPRLGVVEIAAALLSLAAALGWGLWRPEAMALVAGGVTLAAARALGFFLASPLRLSGASFGGLKRLAGFGSYQMGERALTYAAMNLDRLLVARLLGASAAGLYTVASQIALRPLALLGPLVFRTLFPLLARLQEERDRMASSYLRALSVLALPAAALLALLAGLAGPLVRLVLGSGWEESIPVLRLLAGLGFLWTLSLPLASVTMALGKYRAAFWINVAVLAANALALFIGARFGIQGAAAAMLLAALASLSLDFWLAKRWLDIALPRLLDSMSWPLPAALVAGLAAQAAVSAASTLPDWVQLAAGLLAGCIVFLLVLRMRRARLAEALNEYRNKAGI